MTYLSTTNLTDYSSASNLGTAHTDIVFILQRMKSESVHQQQLLEEQQHMIRGLQRDVVALRKERDDMASDLEAAKATVSVNHNSQSFSFPPLECVVCIIIVLQLVLMSILSTIHGPKCMGL